MSRADAPCRVSSSSRLAKAVLSGSAIYGTRLLMTKDEIVHEIGEMLIQDCKICSRRWQHLVIVAQLTELSTKVNGFAYEATTGDAVPSSPSNAKIPAKFKELRDAMRDPGKERWRACLLRIDSSSGGMSIDFEYDHPEKWLINPATARKMAQSLRPAAELPPCCLVKRRVLVELLVVDYNRTCSASSGIPNFPSAAAVMLQCVPVAGISAADN
jgi:hypothetical protein